VSEVQSGSRPAGVRRWSLNAISLVVIGAVLLTLTAVMLTRRDLLPGPDQSLLFDYFGEAQRSQTDPAAWLAALASRFPPERDFGRTTLCYQQAVGLMPESPAPHLLYALACLDQVPLERSEIRALMPEETTGETRPLTSLQRERLASAMAALARAERLDPTNAAIDYVRAYFALADHQDEAGLRYLRVALGKRQWNLYGREAAIAGYQVAQRRVPAGFAATVAITTIDSGAVGQIKLIFFARVVTAMSVMATRRRDDAEAIFLREVMMHLSRLMLANARTVVGGLVGGIMWSVATEPEASELAAAGRQARSASGRGSRSSGRASTESAFAAKRAARGLLARYLRQHGRADLAGEVISYGKAVDDWLQRVQANNAGERVELLRMSFVQEALKEFMGAAMACLILALLIAVAALVVERRGRRVRPIAFSRLGWVLVVLACVGTALAVGVLLTPGVRAASAGWADRVLVDVTGAFAVIGLPLILLSVLLVVIARRRRPKVQDVGLLRSYLGTSLSILLPLGALLCLASLGLAVPSALAMWRITDRNRAAVYQGELATYGLTPPAGRRN